MWVLNSMVFLVPVAVVVMRMLSPRGLRGAGERIEGRAAVQ
jgi:hypothetical protein